MADGVTIVMGSWRQEDELIESIVVVVVETAVALALENVTAPKSASESVLQRAGVQNEGASAIHSALANWTGDDGEIVGDS